jgi:hypothetical protein
LLHHHYKTSHTAIAKPTIHPLVGRDLGEGNLENTLEFLQEIQLPPNVTQESMRVYNLLSLPHLPIRHTEGKKPLIDYS